MAETDHGRSGHVPGAAEGRDFRLLWTGSAASQLGNMASTVTAPLLGLSLTGSPVFAGWLAAAGTLPRILLHLPAGVLVDYSDRRRMMIASMAVRAALAVLMVGCVLVDEGVVYLLPVISVAQGICVVLYSTAETTAVPWLVPRHRLPRAMAGNEARTHVAGLLGRPLGGWLFELGRVWPFVLDVAASAVSLLTLLRMRNKRFTRSATRRPPRPARHLRAFWRGLTFLRKEEFLARVMIVCALANFSFQTLGLSLVLLAHERHLSPLVIGLLIAASGLGGVLGSLMAPRLLRRTTPARLIVTSVWAWLLLSASLVVVDHDSFLYVAAVLPAVWGGIGFTGAHINIALALYQTSGVPKRLFGRVTSVIRFCSGSAVPLGSLAGGYLLAAFGTEGAVVLVTCVVGLLTLLISVPATASSLRLFRGKRPGDRARHGRGQLPRHVVEQVVAQRMETALQARLYGGRRLRGHRGGPRLKVRLVHRAAQRLDPAMDPRRAQRAQPRDRDTGRQVLHAYLAKLLEPVLAAQAGQAVAAHVERDAHGQAELQHGRLRVRERREQLAAMGVPSFRFALLRRRRAVLLGPDPLDDHGVARAGQRGQHGAAAGDQGEQCGFTDQGCLL
ncbi:MFS transporter [Nonomuraea sp. MG754425]|uniref:MFS transporter n=1 Tax=Nonomuraea sp. MG754425 TaxID=2570319 RepID=UPI001F1EB441|nr:MFS transporter [Nonomuraea sp. MG754425]